jgi:hypothetical protein
VADELHRSGGMASQRILGRVSSFAAGLLVVACSSASTSWGFGDGYDGGTNGGSGSQSGGGGGRAAPEAGPVVSFGSSSGSSGTGARVEGGIPTGPVDVRPPCDTGLPVDGNATAFARSIGICATAAQDGWGLVSATYQNAFGASAPPAAEQWGLLPAFGGSIVPREGSVLGVLSSGYARPWDDPTGHNQGQISDFVAGYPRDGTAYPTGRAPPGYPKAAQGCPQDDLVNDMIEVKLVLVAPPDATGLKFDFDFFSSEWPNYVCSNYNDAFVAYLTSSSMTGNISFDSKNDPVAVNMTFMNRCTPGAPVGCLRSDGPYPDPPLYISMCSAGPQELLATGYGDTYGTQCDPGAAANVVATLGASTGWLTTTAPILPGEQFTLELMIWDAGDGLLDSSVLVDNFQWLGGADSVPTGTQPAQ